MLRVRLVAYLYHSINIQNLSVYSKEVNKVALLYKIKQKAARHFPEEKSWFGKQRNQQIELNQTQPLFLLPSKTLVTLSRDNEICPTFHTAKTDPVGHSLFNLFYPKSTLQILIYKDLRTCMVGDDHHVNFKL